MSSFVANFAIDSDEMECVATSCWFVAAHAKFIWHKEYFRERSVLMWFYEIHVVTTRYGWRGVCDDKIGVERGA